MLERIFNRRKKLYFAVVVSDRPTDGFEFKPDKDCQMFMVTGDVRDGIVIPPTVLKEMVERFRKPTLEGQVKISEKKINPTA